MRVQLTILAVLIFTLLSGCEQSVSIATLDQTASDIFDGTIAPNENGECNVDAKNNVINNIAYVTTKADDGSKLILFRTWQGKGSNLRGILYTNGSPLKVGSTVELITFAPLDPSDGDLPINKVDVSIDAEITKTCYRVSYSLD